MLQVILKFFQLIFAGIITYAGYWVESDPIFGFVSKSKEHIFLLEWRWLIILGFIFFTIVLEIWANLSEILQRTHIIQKILDYILHNRFPKELGSVRVTLFKVERGVLVMIRLVYRYLKLLIVRLGKGFDGNLQFPNLIQKAIVVYKRSGNRPATTSFTHFTFPLSDDDVEGIISASIFEKAPKIKKFSLIHRNRLNKVKSTRDLRDQTLKSSIVKYMEDGEIHNFSTLKKISHLAKELCSIPIISEEKVWGALVVDSDSENNSIAARFKQLKDDAKILVLQVGK